MAISKDVTLNDFSRGIAPDRADDELGSNEAVTMVNIDNSDQKMRTLPGAGSIHTDLTDSERFIPEGIDSFLLTDPRESHAAPPADFMTVVCGTHTTGGGLPKSGKTSLYVYPRMIPSNVTPYDPDFELGWVELTEELTLTALAGTNGAVIVGDAASLPFTDQILLQTAVDGYYNDWIIYNRTRSEVSRVVSSDLGTFTLTMDHPITAQTVGDDIFLMRNPVWDKDLNYLFNPEPECRFIPLENTMGILTGSTTDYPTKSDLRINIMYNRQLFNAANPYTGIHLTRKNIDFIPAREVVNTAQLLAPAPSVLIASVITDEANLEINGILNDGAVNFITAGVRPNDLIVNTVSGDTVHVSSIISTTALYISGTIVQANWNNTDTYEIRRTNVDALPRNAADDTNFLYIVTAVYDGFQESAIEQGLDPFGAVNFPANGNGALDTAAADRVLNIILSVNIIQTVSDGGVPSSVYVGDLEENDHLIFDRRITAFNIYLAQSEGLGDVRSPSTEWRLVKTISVDDGGWANDATVAPNGAAKLIDFTIYGSDWTAATATDIETYQGHTAVRITANSKFAEFAGQKAAYMHVHIDQERKDFVIESPTRGAGDLVGFNMYDVIPWTGSGIDTSSNGVTEIIGVTESGDSLFIFGANKVLKITLSPLTQNVNLQKIGLVGPDAVFSYNRLIFFADKNDIYLFNSDFGAAGIAKSIAAGKIRKLWKNLPLATKEKLQIGFDKCFQKLIFSVPGRTFLLNVPRIIADPLTEDGRTEFSWSDYAPVDAMGVTLFFETITVLEDDTVVGTVDGENEIYHLLKSGVENTMDYDSPVLQGPVDSAVVRMFYRSTGNVPVELFDTTSGTNFSVISYTFYINSDNTPETFYGGPLINRLRLKLTGPLNTEIHRILIGASRVDDDDME